MSLAEIYGVKGISPIRVALIDDHPILSKGMDDYLTYCKLEGEPVDWAGNACSIEKAKELVDSAMPDVLLLDIFLENAKEGHLSSLSFFEDLKCDNKGNIPVIVYTGAIGAPETLAKFRQAGVQGIIFKHEPLEHILEAIYSVYTGNSYFSDEVCKLMGWASEMLSDYHIRLRLPQLSHQEAAYLSLALDKNLSRLDIAQEMNIAVSTVSEYRDRAFRKLKISHINQLDAQLVKKYLAESNLND